MIETSPLSGILIIDKPQAWTSHDVVAKVRRVFKLKKVGHAGTLDPMATGVLIVLLGKATKQSDLLLNQDKVYQAMIRFGQQTDTGDAEGQIIKEEVVVSRQLSKEDVERAIEPLLGQRLQQVPAFSAVKIGGKKLYELARKDQPLPERPSRTITVGSIKLDHFSPASDTAPATAQITIECSKGTYIRVLAEELAHQLGTVGHLTALRRLASGRFTIALAVELDELVNSQNPAQYLQPVTGT